MIYLEGTIKTRKYEKDDVEHYITEVVLPMFGGEVKVLLRGKDEDAAGGDEPSGSGIDPEDDIPF